MSNRPKKTKTIEQIVEIETIDQILDRWAFVEHLHRNFENTIRAAIYTVLSEGWKHLDRSIEAEDIYQDILIGPVFRFADKLQAKGTASLKRRLYRLAETHVRAYPLKEAQTRGAAVERALREAPHKIRHLVEIKVMVSPEELASEKLASEAA